ncbi:MAG: hypothetical protein HY906_12610, partial [Deltaproteobacteria bacterium]|nr:hypothetical protein [Deltaproteobacteria bacterium]
MSSRGVAESTAEILRLIGEMRAGRGEVRPAPAAPQPTPPRLEVERWREAFYCDAVAERLAAICSLLEERVDALEGEFTAPRAAPGAGDVGRRAGGGPGPPAAGARPTWPAEEVEPGARGAPPAALGTATPESGRSLAPAPAEGALLTGPIQEGVV